MVAARCLATQEWTQARAPRSIPGRGGSPGRSRRTGQATTFQEGGLPGGVTPSKSSCENGKTSWSEQ
jgi:hypothetical protein